MIFRIIAAMLGTYAFAIIFSAPKKNQLLCAVIGGAGWLIYELITMTGPYGIFASLIAAVIITVMSRISSYAAKTPVTVFLISGILPLVPGAGIYYTAFYSFMEDYQQALIKGGETLMIAGAVVFGILFGLSVPDKAIGFVTKRILKVQ